MTEYKPPSEKATSFWVNRVDRDGLACQLINTPQSNSEEIDYKSEYERVVRENKELCLMIGDLVSEKCKLTIELNKLKSHPVETVYNEDERVFSNDCATAVKELLEIIKNNKHFRYTCHRQKDVNNAYYSIINNMDITIFYLEDHSENNHEPPLSGFALITTPVPGQLVEGYKHKYASVCGTWSYRTTSRSTRKRYDIRGKKILDVIDIFNNFR